MRRSFTITRSDQVGEEFGRVMFPSEKKLVTVDGFRGQKSKRIEKFSLTLTSRNDIPKTYTSIIEREKLCAQYISNFIEKFEDHFNTSCQLLFHCPNECGVEKFICSTLRPATFPYPGFQTVAQISDFVAKFLHYEPLENGLQCPEYIPSSNAVIDWKIGDSFDFALLLCSLLLGVGYDAYVAYGSAPYFITVKDQSKIPLGETEKRDFYTKIFGGQHRISNEESKQRSSHKEAAEEIDPTDTFEIMKSVSVELNASVDERSIRDIFEREIEVERRNDALYGKRKHAWVLVLSGSEDVPAAICIEPTTGRQFSVKDCPYLSVDAVFNEKNYWINKKGSLPVTDMDYDFSNSDIWEAVFNPRNKQDDPAATLQTLEPPISWVSKLNLSKKDYFTLYPPNGSRVILYLRSKVELYSEGANKEGLLKRITLYDDEDRSNVVEIWEKYRWRKDRLIQRVKKMAAPAVRGFVYEKFDAGRSDGIKEIIEFNSEEKIWNFYTDSRFDRMIHRREIYGKKIFQHYKDRPDRLYYRSLSVLSKSNNSKASKVSDNIQCMFIASSDCSLPTTRSTIYSDPSEQLIDKMTEKFSRDESVEPELDASKKSYFVSRSHIHIKYHYAESRISCAWETIWKDKRYQSNATSDENTSEEAAEQRLSKVLRSEKKCFDAMRHTQEEMIAIGKARIKDEANVVLERPLHHVVHERYIEDELPNRSEVSNEMVNDSELSSDQKNDYLYPFLSHVESIEKITFDEAVRAREACLLSTKERLLERANIINARLIEENHKLTERQALHQTENDTTDGDYDQFCADTTFRIQVLEQRLIDHEEYAVKKYEQLEKKLRGDPRLRVLSSA